MAIFVGLLIFLVPPILCAVGAVILWKKSNKAALDRTRRNNFRIAASILAVIGVVLVLALFFGG